MTALCLPCDWNAGVRLAHGWKTAVKRAKSGREQRSARWGWPRRKLAYDLPILEASDLRRLTAWLHAYGHTVVTLPLWPDGTELAGEAASGQPDVTVVDSSDRRFVTRVSTRPARVILVDPDDPWIYEEGEISAIAGDTLTLQSNLSSTWPAGTLVYPALRARLGRPEARLATMRMALSRIEAEEAYEADSANSQAAAEYQSWDTWRGYDLFLVRPDWADDPKHGWERMVDRLDYGGLVYPSAEENDTSLLFSAVWRALSRSECWELAEFFDDHGGQLTPFWLPTWREDLVVAAAFAADAVELTIEDSGYNAAWTASEQLRAIYIEWPDGSWICRDVVDVDGETTITLSEAVGTACSAADLPGLRVSFLLFVRFDQDELEFDCQLPDAARASLAFRSVPEERPDTADLPADGLPIHADDLSTPATPVYVSIAGPLGYNRLHDAGEPDRLRLDYLLSGADRYQAFVWDLPEALGGVGNGDGDRESYWFEILAAWPACGLSTITGRIMLGVFQPILASPPVTGVGMEIAVGNVSSATYIASKYSSSAWEDMDADFIGVYVGQGPTMIRLVADADSGVATLYTYRWPSMTPINSQSIILVPAGGTNLWRYGLTKIGIWGYPAPTMINDVLRLDGGKRLP